MIFLVLGTQKFPFNRLLCEIDKLIEKGSITQTVFAQVGASTYLPKCYEYVSFLSPKEFDKKLEMCNLVITHGGAGTILEAMEKKKKIIAVPRLQKFGEHVDNHQKEIIHTFEKKQYIMGVQDMSQLERAVLKVQNFHPKPFQRENTRILHIVNGFLNEMNIGSSVK